MHFTVSIVGESIAFDTHLFPKGLYRSDPCMLCPQMLGEWRTRKYSCACVTSDVYICRTIAC